MKAQRIVLMAVLLVYGTGCAVAPAVAPALAPAAVPAGLTAAEQVVAIAVVPAVAGAAIMLDGEEPVAEAEAVPIVDPAMHSMNHPESWPLASGLYSQFMPFENGTRFGSPKGDGRSNGSIEAWAGKSAGVIRFGMFYVVSGHSSYIVVDAPGGEYPQGVPAGLRGVPGTNWAYDPKAAYWYAAWYITQGIGKGPQAPPESARVKVNIGRAYFDQARAMYGLTVQVMEFPLPCP